MSQRYLASNTEKAFPCGAYITTFFILMIKTSLKSKRACIYIVQQQITSFSQHFEANITHKTQTDIKKNRRFRSGDVSLLRIAPSTVLANIDLLYLHCAYLLTQVNLNVPVFNEPINLQHSLSRGSITHSNTMSTEQHLSICLALQQFNQCQHKSQQ